MPTGDLMAVCPVCGEMYYHVNGHTCKQPKSAYIMPSPDAYALLKAELIDLRDRVAVLEERTCDHESRLEDLEKKADDD